MAVAPWTQFDYVAEFDAEGIGVDAITLQARSRAESAESVLVGHHPRIRFWGDLMHLEASDPSGATLRRAAYVVGDAVLLIAQAKDSLNLKCTATGDLALSVVRGGQLVLALGAVAEVPLGEHLSATNRFEGDEVWLEVTTPRQDSCRLRERESGRVDGYDVYLERACTWHRDTDGDSECGSIVQTAHSKAVNAAIRGAVLLGGVRTDVPKWQHWDGRFVD